MFHPLEEDLSAKSTDEIEKRLGELGKKYMIAARLGQNHVLTQLQTFVTIYRNELTSRHMKQLADQDQDMNKLINVDRN